MLELSRKTLESAKVAAEAAPRFSGCVSCARVYVTLPGRVTAKTVRLAKTFGFLIFPRPRHLPAIYCGYDNADGRTYGRAIAIAAALRADGISAYEDADED